MLPKGYLCYRAHARPRPPATCSMTASQSRSIYGWPTRASRPPPNSGERTTACAACASARIPVSGAS